MTTEVAPAASAAAGQEEEDDDEDQLGDTSWLLSVAAPDERALALLTRVAAREATVDTIHRCTAIIKDADAHIYRRGLAVLALGRALGRELRKPYPRKSVSNQLEDLLQKLSGPGEILDSVLDIVGQCTPSPPTKAGEQGQAQAMSAGCGAADAHTIRTNCCALISLLASAALVPKGTATTGDRGTENGVEITALNQEASNPPEECVIKDIGDGVLPPNIGDDVHGGNSWDKFISMRAKPNPDVVCLVRKKGWAARQEQQRLQPTTVVMASGWSTTRGQGSCDRVKTKKGRRPHQYGRSVENNGTTCHGGPALCTTTAIDINRGKNRVFHEGLVIPPGQRSDRQKQARTAFDVTLSNSARRIDNGNQRVGGDERRRAGRSGGAFAENDAQGSKGSVQKRSASDFQQLHRQHHDSISDHLASPPRICRVTGGGFPIRPLSPGRSPTSARQRGANSVGCSISRGNPRNDSLKVWHDVTISRRKRRGERSTDAQSPPAITLMARGVSERFMTQPRVRPAVIFGSDPARELKSSTFWGRDNDGIAADANLGYQIPRVWFPHSQPGQAGAYLEERAPASAGVVMPEPRPRAFWGADLPIGSDGVVQEYQQMQAFRAYSALSETRPSSAEQPLHGLDANAAVIRALGRPPEDEDSAIAREWSPRGGRRLQSIRRPRLHWAPVSPDLGNHAEHRPNALLSHSPARRRRGKRKRREGRGHGGEGRRGGRARAIQNFSASGDSDEDGVHATSDDSSSVGSISGHPFDSNTHYPLDLLSPQPRRFIDNTAHEDATKFMGNLGGPFTRPESPYRTYRAKHARLLRAQSSERAAAEMKLSISQASSEKRWLPGSRSTDTGDGSRRGRSRGSSGMRSPLLRGAQFGLLESSVTGKVALGYQLPRDRLSASGRERTAVATAEQELRFAYESVSASSTPEHTAIMRQNVAHRRRGWLPVHHDGSLTDGETATPHEGYPYSGRASKRGQGYDVLPRRSSGTGSHERSILVSGSKSGREEFSVSTYFVQAGTRWPSSPKRMNRGSNRFCSSLGRRRDVSRRSRRRVLSRCSESFSWSPPTTRNSTARDSFTCGPECKEEEEGIGRTRHYHRCGFVNPRHRRRHRSLSPLMLPLDPFRSSRTVIRAGTLVSRRDAFCAERSSRRAARGIRRVFEARITAERHSADEAVLVISSPGRGRTKQWQRQHQQQREGRNGRNAGGLGEGREGACTTSGIFLDAEEERWGHKTRRLLPSVASIERELEVIKRADAAMREEQLAQVQLNTNALPLALLLVHPGGAARARDFVARALQLWLREKTRARMTHALARWKIECEAQRFRERGLGYRTRFGALKLKQLMERRRPVILRARLATWRVFCRMEIYTLRAASVLRVQTQYRRWRAFRLFLSMHYRKPLGGALSDIYLEEEREGLLFKVDSSVRKDRRCFWTASITIQTRWRMLPKRTFYRLMKKAAMRVQTHFRMWSDRRVYVIFRQQTIVAQSFARLAIWRPKWCRFRVIPLVIQRFVRGHLARQKTRRMRLARYRALEKTMGKIEPFQKTWRGFIARKRLRIVREEKDNEWHAAVLLQRAWYRRMGQFPAFVLVSCLRIMDKSDEDDAIAARLFDLKLHARIIQRIYRRRYRSRRRRAAILLQSWWRIKTGTDFVTRLRAERWASRKLRCWLVVLMKRKHHASWLIAMCWLTSRPGRLLKHLQDNQRREEEQWWKEWRERRGLAAAKLQAAVRGQRVRRHRRVEAAAGLVQRVVRGFIHCRRVRKRLVMRRTEHTREYVAELLQEGIRKEASRQARIMALAAEKLRACGRGLATRMILKHAAERVRSEILMAMRVQRLWRYRRLMLTAKRQALKEQRRANVAFASVGPQVEAVATASIKAASVHLNPRNGPAGCGLWRLCRRLGCDGDVFPLLKSAGISGAEALRELSDEDLKKIGISDVSRAKQRQGAGRGGNGGERIFEAENLRALLMGLVCTVDPAQPPPSTDAEKVLFEDFECIEGDSQRRTTIRRVFDDAFGAGLNQRAENFAAAFLKGGAGERTEVTVHQLRRYFRLCGTPSAAKARLPSLINPSPEEDRRASLEDRRRLSLSLSMLATGAERVCYLYRVPALEVRSGRGGPATELLTAMQSLLEMADNEEQQQRARRAARGDTFEILDENRRAMLAVATSLYDHLQHLAALGPAARIVQRAYRSHTGRNFLALSRHQLALKRHTDRYLWERGANHVKAEWERARKEEAEEKQRQYEEWLKQEEKRQIEEELYRWGVLRYGWREEDLEGVPGVKVYRFYKRVRAKRDAAEVGPKGPDMVDALQEESEVYPLYRYEDEMAARVLVRAGRAYIARKALYILRRDKLRLEKERLERIEWERAERIADQHLTVRLPLVTVSGKRYFHATADDFIEEPFVEGEFEPPSDDHLDLWVGFLLDARTPARLSNSPRPTSRGRKGNTNSAAKTATTSGSNSTRISKNSSPSAPGRGVAGGKWRGPGEGWMRGEVIMVNPSEVVSAEGVKRYPKGTFGIRYLDTGEEIPNVPRDCIRVLTLTPGMKVEARYGGGLDFYPGVIDSVNSRNGLALSYSVKYEDGDFEKVVKRGHIAPYPEEVAALDAVTTEMTRKAAIRRERAQFLQRRRAAVASAWRERVQKAEDDYLAAAAAASTAKPQQRQKGSAASGRKSPRPRVSVGGTVASRRSGNGRASTRPNVSGGAAGRVVNRKRESAHDSIEGGVGNADALACIGMIDAAARLQEELRPRVAVALKIDYTRQATRFGCSQVQTSSGLLWRSKITGVYTRGRPRYTFEEVSAVRKLQAAWAGLKGRRAFRDQLAKQSIRGLAAACINEAASHAWIGHEEEGMTVEMWLLRAGLTPPIAQRVAAAATRTLAHLAASRGGGGGGGKTGSWGVGKGGGARRTQSIGVSCSTFRNWLGGGGKNIPTASASAGMTRTVGGARGGGGGGGGGAPSGTTGALGAAGDAKLLKLGLESATDRRRLMAIVVKEEDNPSFMNWFEGTTDNRMVTSVIAAGEAQAFKLIWKAFPGNQSRAENMAKRIATSSNPVTRMQIAAWLKRHNGRPGVAQSSMSEQLIDVPVVSTREAEAAAYEVFRLFCQHLSILASNMRLKGLSNAIALASAKANDILAAQAKSAAVTEDGKQKEGHAGKDGTAPAGAPSAVDVVQVMRARLVGGEAEPGVDYQVASTWAHARAALVLRKEAVSVALRWVAGAKIIQVNFRGFRCRYSYRSLLARRRRAATILQSAVRRRKAFETAAELREQRASRWEQLWDEENGRLYFYLKDTGESYWEPPDVPFRPMIRDRQSGSLIQAWPQLEKELLEAMGAAPGFCMLCKTERATRICDQCTFDQRKKLPWGDGKFHLCFVCFAERHADTPGLTDHTFTAVQTPGRGELLCSLCDRPAKRRCRGLEVPDRALIVAARLLQKAQLAKLLEDAADKKGGNIRPASSLLRSGVNRNTPSVGGAAAATSLSPVHHSKAKSAIADGARTAIIKADARGEGRKNNRKKAGAPPVSREEFERILAICHLPYSRTWANAAYELCLGEEGRGGKVDAASVASTATTTATGSQDSVSTYSKGNNKNKKGRVYRTREQFWASFGAALVGASEDCDDLLCGECWESVHKRGVRKIHRWEGFRAGSPACVACRRSPAERKCNVCNDLLCVACFNDSHARGKKIRHSWQAVLEEPVEMPRCRECQRRVGDKRCGDCGAGLCDSCEAFTHVTVCSGGGDGVRGGGGGGASTGKRALRRAPSNGAIGCGGRVPQGTKRQQKEEDGVFAALNLDGVELQGDARTLRALDQILGLEEALPEDAPATAAGVAQAATEKKAEAESNGDGKAKAYEEDETEEDNELPLSCDVCGKTPDVECEQCRTVYCSNTWAGNPGCFIRDHERGNRRQHTKRGYTHAKDRLARAARLAKEEEERKEREKRQAWEARGKEKNDKKRREKLAQERELARELRLQKEAHKELKRRIRRRRIRAAGLNPSLLPKLRLKATAFAKRRGVFVMQKPSFQQFLRVPPGIAMTTRKLVGALRGVGPGVGTDGEESDRKRLQREAVSPLKSESRGKKSKSRSTRRNKSKSRSRSRSRSRSVNRGKSRSRGPVKGNR